jgi:hypothetical protein
MIIIKKQKNKIEKTKNDHLTSKQEKGLTSKISNTICKVSRNVWCTNTKNCNSNKHKRLQKKKKQAYFVVNLGV